MEAIRRSRKPAAVHQTDCLVDGQWTPAQSGGTLLTLDPATEEVIAQVAAGDAVDIEAAAEAARKAVRGDWSRGINRGSVLTALAELIESEIDDLSALESWDTGHPIRGIRGADLPAAVEYLRLAAEYANADGVEPQSNVVPVGVAGFLLPTHHAALSSVRSIARVVVAGCGAVLKPSEHAPLACLRLVRMAQKAGVPDGVLNVVPGTGARAGRALANCSLVDSLVFHGRAATGREVCEAAARNLTPVSLELAGSEVHVVLRDADLEEAARSIASFANGGELGRMATGACCLVERPVQETFRNLLFRRLDGLKIGDPLDSSVDVGPLACEGDAVAFAHFVERCVRDGAVCLAGGKRFGTRGFFVQPTLLTDIADPSVAMAWDVAAPLGSLVSISAEDEIIERFNARRIRSRVVVWTRDSAAARRLAGSLNTAEIRMGNSEGRAMRADVVASDLQALVMSKHVA